MSKNKGFQQEISTELIRQAQRKDMNAFEQIYVTYADACYGLALRICGQPAVAEDIVQESFMKLMNRIDTYRADGLFAGWLSKIVTYETINRLKANNKVYSLTEEQMLAEEAVDLFDCNWLEACLDLDSLLDNLSATARAVFILHEVEGFNHKEIADFFFRTESFSKVTLSRAYKLLRDVVATAEQESKYALK